MIRHAVKYHQMSCCCTRAFIFLSRSLSDAVKNVFVNYALSLSLSDVIYDVVKGDKIPENVKLLLLLVEKRRKIEGLLWRDQEKDYLISVSRGFTNAQTD